MTSLRIFFNRRFLGGFLRVDCLVSFDSGGWDSSTQLRVYGDAAIPLGVLRCG